jgi:hypothetical protein
MIMDRMILFTAVATNDSAGNGQKNDAGEK